MQKTENLDSLKAGLSGELIQKGDAGYDEACKLYNAMIHKRPRYIVKCRDAADVMAAVNFGRENNLLTAIRGGGHNGGGLGSCDDGLVIDLSGIKYVTVDPEARTARVGGGSLLKEVDHATHAFGLAFPAGIIGTTGVGGLTLGGGIGHLTRSCGLSIDNILEADVVLADGSFVKASQTQNPDLFWAIRGGGGNYGVVTSFLLQLHPVSMVYAGPILYDLDQTEEVLKWYRNFIGQAPRELNGFFAFIMVPPAEPFPKDLHLRKMCAVVWCYSGDMRNAEKAFEPIRAFKKPALDLAGPLPLPALQTMFDGLYIPGLQWYWRADFMNEISDEAIQEHIRFGQALPTMHSSMHLYPIDGAAAEPSETDTPWAYRHAKWAQVIVGVDPSPANAGLITQWTKDYWEALHPYSAGGAYVNFMMDEGQERVQATYGSNYNRLAEIKAKYDPQNFFRVNQNIQPQVKQAEPV